MTGRGVMLRLMAVGTSLLLAGIAAYLEREGLVPAASPAKPAA